jgi:protein translocase SecG subunit
MIANLPKIISITQIVISSFLILTILLQQRGAGGSAIMGGGGASYYTKRGFEKILSIAIVILSTLFILAAIASIFVATRY